MFFLPDRFKNLKRFPLIRQRDMTECGSTCLAMLFRHHGLADAQALLRDLTCVRKVGTDLLTLREIARSFGFRADGYKLGYEQLSQVTLPCIAHYEGNHFVVLYKLAGSHVWIANPLAGRARLHKEEFLSKWDGIILTVTPSQRVFENKALVPELRARKARGAAILKRFYLTLFQRARAKLLIILGVSLPLQLFGLALPGLIQRVVDQTLLYPERAWRYVVPALLAVAFIYALIMYARDLLIAQFKLSLESSFIDRLFDHLLSLELTYFDRHGADDFNSLWQQTIRVRRLLLPQVIEPFIDTILLFNYLVLLSLFSGTLALLLLVFICSLLALTILYMPKLREVEGRFMHDQQEMMNVVRDALNGMQTVKLLNLQNWKLARWRDERAKAVKTLWDAEKFCARFHARFRGVFFFGQATLLLLVAHMTYRGRLTVGECVAFVVIWGFAAAALSGAFSLMFVVNGIAAGFAPINGALTEESRELHPVAPARRIESCPRIELRNVSFRYVLHTETLKGLNLRIEPGEQIAIVGCSGAGKTTLARLLTKLYLDYEGEILIDGVTLKDIGFSHVREKIYLLPRDVYLFASTIAENIRCGHATASGAEIIKSAQMAGADGFIGKFYLKYDHKVLDNGSSLTRQQKIQIALARLFLRRPEIIILDEIDRELGPGAENLLMSNIREQFAGKTIISVASRVRTAKNASRIIFMEEGRIAEEGGHEALLKSGGPYSRWVRTRLAEV